VLFATFFGKFLLAAIIAGGIVFLLAPDDYKETAILVALGITGILFLMAYCISMLLIFYKKMKSGIRIPLVDNVVSLFFS
jgi:energy-converting hydrogenase Eha subunit C